MKGVFVVLDGVSDEFCNALNGKTPLEAANTPNLDALTKMGKLDYCYPVKESFVPESDSAIVSLLGYDFVNEGRGSLEALGLNINIRNGDLVLRTNFASVEDLESRNVLDRRAGRTLTHKEAKILAAAINDRVKLKYPFQFYLGQGHRGVLVIKGGFSNNISDVDVVKHDKFEFSKPYDEDDDGKLSSDVVNSFIRQSFEILDMHSVNLGRAKMGLFSANMLLCRGAANKPAKLKKLRGKWMALGYTPLEMGICRATGMDIYKFKYPKLKKMDVYQNLNVGLKLATRYATRMLSWHRKKYDYFFIHFKETDIPSLDNKPLEKVKMIEMIDERFFGYLRKILGDAKLVVTSSYTTSSRQKMNIDKPVPVLSIPGKANAERFVESEGMKGRKIIGKKLLGEKLFINFKKV